MSHWETPGRSDEWFTPASVFRALGCQFDMDVAAPKGIVTHVPAREFLTSGSLSAIWRGFVWMNPPFGGRNALEPWLAKFIDHGNGIALTPDRTSAPWFQSALPMMDRVLFTRKLRFIRPDQSEGKSPSNGTALMGIGPQASAAIERAACQGFGIMLLPAEKAA